MAVGNARIADIFDEVGDLLEISGENFFRVRAYHNAARVVRDLSTSVEEVAAEPDRDLTELPGIGKDLAGKIHTILETGDLPMRQELESQIPIGLMDVMKVAGVGPRKAHTLFLELGVKDLDSLGEAARAGSIKKLKGFGPKTEENILEGVYAVKGMGNRARWADAEQLMISVTEYMRAVPGLRAIEAAGSFRRLRETVGDLDLLVVCDDPELASQRFVSHPDVARVIAHGPTKTSVVMGRDSQVDIRVIPAESFGAALQYFTGSQAHAVAVRGMALRKGMKLNEYGVFREDERLAGRTEEDVYQAIGLPWIPPELRENRGEIRAALEGELPALIEEKDIRGDLHVHTDATDGRDTLAAMVAEAKKRGYLYIAITNHTQRVTMVGGLDERGLLEHWEAVERVAEGVEGIHVLKGVEVDILRDGSLDIADAVLARADVVVASVHYDTDMQRPQMTHRIVRALENPLVDILGHATGRKINERPPYNVNMDEVIAAAARTGTALELNSNPKRLDIDDHNCRSAREHGVKVVVATDAHSARELSFLRYGINQARRGWLEKGDVLNALTYRGLSKDLRKKVRAR
ncbi:MAG TPA: DNA polymerase/3'-5' exonuclease PolX [Candidatus Anoxymicrobiaceae bacterium]